MMRRGCAPHAVAISCMKIGTQRRVLFRLRPNSADAVSSRPRLQLRLVRGRPRLPTLYLR